MTVPKWKSLLGKIVWLEDPLKYTYLRESNYLSCSSVFPKKWKCRGYTGKTIGYELQSHPSHMCFHFRYWWLKSYDRDLDPEGIYKYNDPSEAMIPSSISVGTKSEEYQTPKELLVHWADHMEQLRKEGEENDSS